MYSLHLDIMQPCRHLSVAASQKRLYSTQTFLLSGPDHFLFHCIKKKVKRLFLSLSLESNTKKLHHFGVNTVFRDAIML